jgi:phosphate uptake regulator
MSKTNIDAQNVDINKKLVQLQAGYDLLNKDDALLTTQKEMVRYTEEKNNFTNNRIAVWTALNVLALGAIFYVYQKA